MTALDRWELPGAAPLYATARNLDRPTDGPQIRVIARHLGTPLIPWQRYTSDVANERNPDGSYAYPIVVVSVPRQTGKTTLLRATGVHRCLVCGRDVFYTAQTGKDARERWTDLVAQLRVDPALSSRITTTLRGGSERVTFNDTGAAFRVFAPTPESLHGYTPPTVMADEIFALTGGSGDLLMGAIGPAQITVRDKQVWLVSTAGTAESEFLHAWIDRAMEGTPGVAGFIWGASDQMNPYDLDDIARFHPGVGFPLNGNVLTPHDVLAQSERNSRAEYERAFANRRTQTAAHLIPSETWRPMHDPAQAPPTSTSELVLSYDVSVDRLGAAILAAWTGPDGRPTIRVVRAENGVTWLAGAVADYARRWRPRAVTAVGNGPVTDTTGEVRRGGVDVTELGERDYAAACTRWMTLIETGGMTHDGTERLERAVTGLVPRTSGGDGLAFSRRHSVGDSSPAVAGIAAMHVLAAQPSGMPTIYFHGDES